MIHSVSVYLLIGAFLIEEMNIVIISIYWPTFFTENRSRTEKYGYIRMLFDRQRRISLGNAWKQIHRYMWLAENTVVMLDFTFVVRLYNSMVNFKDICWEHSCDVLLTFIWLKRIFK